MCSNGNSFSFSNGHSHSTGDGTYPEPWIWRLTGQIQPGAVGS